MAAEFLGGVMPILQTPFDEGGEILYEDLRSEVEFAITCSVDGLGIAMGSEIPKLSEHERDEVLRTVVGQADGRVPVIMNTGAQSTSLTIQLSHSAAELSADALMIAPPTLAAHPAEDLEKHYLGVAYAVDLQIMLQDIGTAPLSPPLMARLSRSHERIRYAKVETLPTPPRFVETAAMAGDKLRLFGGANGQYFIEELNRGSRGTMQGIAIADVVRKVWDQYHGGDPDGAAMLWDRFSPLVKLCSIGQGMSPWLVKETLRRRGVISKAFPRLPARKPDDIAYRELHSLLDRLDLG